jgi:hypothetical protein
LKKIGHFNVTDTWGNEVFELLVSENALAHLKFLKNNGRRINVSLDSFTEACKRGNLEMVCFLDENNDTCYINNLRPMEIAAQYRQPKIVKILHKKGYKCSGLVMEWAAHNKDFDLVDIT